MRLLRLEDDGEFSLVEYVGKITLCYAILSHTWGTDDEEVTFKDIVKGTGKSKVGYSKIRFCGEQAVKDGLRFIWVDTCCINKSSSAELSEAINSMFCWYQNAAKCYVYLSDVKINGKGLVRNDRSFQESRWFTRGWTLQELVAPMSVEFFSVEGERLGDKRSLVKEIAEVTGISIQALQGCRLSQFSIDERMSWAEKRQTKRGEDAAYSLLGIFGIYMPLIYGEGREKALFRLRKEIKQSLRDAGSMSSLISATRAAEAEAKVRVELYKYHIPFSLRGVPIGKFADRPRDTEALEQALLPQEQSTRRTLVVQGLGGVGKTQLAADFARRHQHSFSSVFWLDGGSESSLKQTLATCASRVPVGQIASTSRMYASGQGGDIHTVVKDMLHWLSKPGNSNWLLVIDNMDWDYRQREQDGKAYDMDAYLPEADHGSVLITTRLAHLLQLGERWELKKVDKDRAQAIFETWYGKEVGQEGGELLELLDGLPLALAQAAAFMSESGISFSTYTRLYKEQWTELMESQNKRDLPLRSYSNGSVATSWMISYMTIQARNKAAANLLLLWAHLDNRSLWYGLLTASKQSAVAAEQTSAWLKEIASDEIEFIKAIGILRNYSLVEEMQGQAGYATHPVVHQWALHVQDNRQRADYSWLAIVVVGLSVPSTEEKQYWEMQMRLLAHAERCKKIIEEATKDGHSSDWQKRDEVTLLCAIHKLGNLFANRGKLDDAEIMYMRALRGREKILGADDTQTLNTVDNLGTLYKDQGKLKNAEKMYMRALEGREKALGVEHSSTLDTIHNLGNLYTNQGKLDDAERMYMRALEGKEKTLEAEHISILDTIHHLGVLYKEQGKLDDTEKMFMRALDGRKKALGLEHTLTLQTVHELGMLYRDQDKLDDAKTMFDQAAEGFKNALGAEHTSTLSTINNLGTLYKIQGKLDIAEKMYKQALEGYKKTLGVEHSLTLNAVNNLGLLYADRGKLDKAERMYGQALEGYKKAVGPEHTSTLNTVNNLGLLYSEQGKLDKAEEMYNRALDGYQKALGLEHPRTLNTVNNLGTLYASQGKLDEAEKMYNKALEGYQKALGPEHTQTLNAINNLGLLYSDSGKLDEAEEMYHRALEGYKKTLGPEHTWTLNTINNIGTLYVDQRRLEEAEQMYNQALKGYENTLGKENILSSIPALNTLWGLASLFDDQNRIEDARALYSQILSGYQQTVGEGHPRCQTLRDHLTALENKKESKASISAETGQIPTHIQAQVDVNSTTGRKPSTSSFNKVLKSLGWKRT